MMIIDRDTEFGARVIKRLESESVIWLTTVDAQGAPQPRPVWFIWENGTFLIYSQATAAKVRHIERRPRVALHFNSNSEGNDIVVCLGTAKLEGEAPPAHRVNAYLEKYRQGIADLGMAEEAFAEEYSVAIRVTPERLRGF